MVIDAIHLQYRNFLHIYIVEHMNKNNELEI